jgi:transcriptional regulator GlxA family with amidase domain
MRIDLLLYQGCDELDVIGPYETLSLVDVTSGQFAVRLVTLTPTPIITAAHRTRLEPHAALADSPDLLIVPGGGWINHAAEGARAELARGELPSAIAAHHTAGATIASVCTGAMLLAGADLLDGRPATTHHGAIEDLRASGARVIEDARVVDDGDILSSAGVTSGIDLALWIIERELGNAAAQVTARELEYTRTGRVWRSSAA